MSSDFPLFQCYHILKLGSDVKTKCSTRKMLIKDFSLYLFTVKNMETLF